MKQRSPLKLSVIAAGLTLLVFGCASAQTVKYTVKPGTQSISIAASNFKFDPNLIEVPSTGVYQLTVTNKAGITHNITVKDPSGNVIASQTLPGGKTEQVSVNFKTNGTYNFLCTVDSHAELGMTGTFEVGTQGK
ncbi:plastocyanin/azurin family copper-binding protein [Salinispira pacifica]